MHYRGLCRIRRPARPLPAHKHFSPRPARDVKDYLYYNHTEGRDQQAGAWERLTDHLGQSADSLENLAGQKGLDQGFKAIITEARSQIDGFSQSLCGVQSLRSIQRRPFDENPGQHHGGGKSRSTRSSTGRKSCCRRPNSLWPTANPTSTARRTSAAGRWRTASPSSKRRWMTGIPRIERSDKLRAEGDKLKRELHRHLPDAAPGFHDEVSPAGPVPVPHENP